MCTTPRTGGYQLDGTIRCANISRNGVLVRLVEDEDEAIPLLGQVIFLWDESLNRGSIIPTQQQVCNDHESRCLLQRTDPEHNYNSICCPISTSRPTESREESRDEREDGSVKMERESTDER